MSKLSIDKFPLLVSLDILTGWRLDALNDISQGVEAGEIRNAVYKEAKDRLNRVAEMAWGQHIRVRFTRAGKWESLPDNVRKFESSISLYGLHQVISANKKLAKCKLEHPMIDAMREIIGELLPLAEAVKDLKSKTVKGRAPSAPKPVDPNKVVKTCPCCFRSIAVVRGKGDTAGLMAHHGYQRPGYGWQTASCAGVQFQALEVSSEGVKHMSARLKVLLEQTEKKLAEKDSVETLKVKVYKRRETVMEPITKEDYRWNRTFESYVRGLEWEIKGIKRDLELFEKTLAEWKQQIPLEEYWKLIQKPR